LLSITTGLLHNISVGRLVPSRSIPTISANTITRDAKPAKIYDCLVKTVLQIPGTGTNGVFDGVQIYTVLLWGLMLIYLALSDIETEIFIWIIHDYNTGGSH
jgi:hypothetical protein